jgi:glycosyltransferase involved in cell wall biosynthesis
MTRATILIPAHNEAEIIGRTLLHLAFGLSSDAFEIVIIANGCSDSTASKARSVLPNAHIIETEEAGKCNALNLGYQVADKCKPVVCLDADLDVTHESLIALLDELQSSGAKAACGHMDVRTNEASNLVRTYYKGWRTHPYFDSGKFGGLFALSPSAAARIFPLPKITADDEFVRRSFAPGERVFVQNCKFTARAPKTFSSLLKVRRRSLRGAREVTSLGLSSPERGSPAAVLGRAMRRPSTMAAVVLFATTNLWVRASLALQKPCGSPTWERDHTTRSAC